MPWGKSVSQSRLWKVRIICCLWLAPLNKKAAVFVQQGLRFSVFASRHHFVTSGREMWIPSLPHIGSQSDLRFNRAILDFSPIYFGIVRLFFKKDITQRVWHFKKNRNVYVDESWKESSIPIKPCEEKKKCYSMYFYKKKNWTEEQYLSVNCTTHLGNWKELKDDQCLKKNKAICFPGY